MRGMKTKTKTKTKKIKNFRIDGTCRWCGQDKIVFLKDGEFICDDCAEDLEEIEGEYGEEQMEDYIINEKHREIIEKEKNKGEYKKLIPIQKFLEKCNLKVWREVVPDECINWDYPYRVDMIFEIPDFGLIGIEGKDINTHGQGGLYANAYLQIRNKYCDKHYFNGKKIRRWCVLGENDSDMGGNRIECFVKHFFNKLGISFIQYKKTSNEEFIVIDVLTKHAIYIEYNKISGLKEDKLDYGGLIT